MDIKPALWKNICKKERKDKEKLQEEICEMNKEPLWIGDGECPKCHRNIYDLLTEKKAGEECVHYCSNCGYSFVE